MSEFKKGDILGRQSCTGELLERVTYLGPADGGLCAIQRGNGIISIVDSCRLKQKEHPAVGEAWLLSACDDDLRGLLFVIKSINGESVKGYMPGARDTDRRKVDCTTQVYNLRRKVEFEELCAYYRNLPG